MARPALAAKPPAKPGKGGKLFGQPRKVVIAGGAGAAVVLGLVVRHYRTKAAGAPNAGVAQVPTYSSVAGDVANTLQPQIDALASGLSQLANQQLAGQQAGGGAQGALPAVPPGETQGPYFGTFPASSNPNLQWGDLARGFAMLPGGKGGYEVDAWGGVHPIAFGNAPLPPDIQHGSYGFYQPGQDVARGITLLPGGTGGYVLDLRGALHPFAFQSPAGSLPAVPAGTPAKVGFPTGSNPSAGLV